VVGGCSWDWVDFVVDVSELGAVVRWAGLALGDGDRMLDTPRKALRLGLGWEPFEYRINNLDEHCSTSSTFLRLQMMSLGGTASPASRTHTFSRAALGE